MDEQRSFVSVDGDVVFEKQEDYGDCRFSLGIGVDLGNDIVVKSVQIK